MRGKMVVINANLLCHKSLEIQRRLLESEVIHSSTPLSPASIESVFRFLSPFTPQCSLLPSSSRWCSTLHTLKIAIAVSRPSTQIALPASRPANLRCSCSTVPPYFVAIADDCIRCFHCCACLIQDSLPTSK